MQVTAFYKYWTGFATVLNFFWEDPHDPTKYCYRKARIYMEEKNKKARKRARMGFNESVRKLASFVKKRDKRVLDMRIKRSAEREKKRLEEKQRMKELDMMKAQRLMYFEESEWANMEEVEEEDDHDDNDDDVKKEKKELHCVVCCKKFKSDKQWENHEQSKRHKEKVADLREAFCDENNNAYDVTCGYQKDADEENGVDGKDKVADVDNNNGTNGVDAELESNKDEASVLESGRKNRKKMVKKAKVPAEKGHVETDSDEFDFRKGSRKNYKGGREEKETEATKATEGRSAEGEEHDEREDEGGQSTSNPLPESETKGTIDDATVDGEENPCEDVKRKKRRRKDKVSKS